MKFDVEKWNNWDYPSHWQFEGDFDNLEDAKSYCRSQKQPDDFRVITVESSGNHA